MLARPRVDPRLALLAAGLPVAAGLVATLVALAGGGAPLDGASPDPLRVPGAGGPGGDGASNARGDPADPGDDGGHGDHDAHGDPAGHGDLPAGPLNRSSIVGLEPYDGPVDAAGVFAACEGLADLQGCYVGLLQDLLRGRGSEAAFLTLEEMAAQSSYVNQRSHPMAHELGAYAYEAYGSIRETLATCSYRVFGGCLHGSLQAYFADVPVLDRSALVGLCPEDTRFRAYTCYHGMGHGLLIATRYDMNRSLVSCDLLLDWWATSSCWGGVFMENVVAFEHADQGLGGHAHEGVEFMVRRGEDRFPCSAVAEVYRSSCWLLQTHLILHFHGGDFRRVAEVCGSLPALERRSCSRGMGSDAASYTLRDVERVTAICAYGIPDVRASCIKGFVTESVLNWATPEVGFPICRGVPEDDKTACYEELAFQGQTMIGPDVMAELCAREAEPAYAEFCRTTTLAFRA